MVILNKNRMILAREYNRLLPRKDSSEDRPIDWNDCNIAMF